MAGEENGRNFSMENSKTVPAVGKSPKAEKRSVGAVVDFSTGEILFAPGNRRASGEGRAPGSVVVAAREGCGP